MRDRRWSGVRTGDGPNFGPRVFRWRMEFAETSDFVIKSGRRLLPIEVKATNRPTYHDAHHLL